jgi:hypothetical protein
MIVYEILRASAYGLDVEVIRAVSRQQKNGRYHWTPAL